MAAPSDNNEPRRKLVVVKFCGLIGFSLAALHAIASLCLLTPAYFAKYFSEDGRLNVEGELGLVVGLVATQATERGSGTRRRRDQSGELEQLGMQRRFAADHGDGSDQVSSRG